MAGKIPDRVPWIETYIHDTLVSRLVGHKVKAPEGALIAPEVYRVLAVDNVSFDLRPPEFVEKRRLNDLEYVGEGKIKTREDWKRYSLPNIASKSFYDPAQRFLDRYKGDKAALAVLRVGISNTYLSMGFENFCYSIYDDLPFVREMLDAFSEWSIEVIREVNGMGFDMIYIGDDLAFGTAPLVSPELFREILFPYMKKVTTEIRLPWIYHSDGNYLPLLGDLLTLGMNCIANIEPGAMDIEELKRDYGGRVVLVGNIDLHYTLTMGTPEETREEVKLRMEKISPGGGYILSSSNGLTGYCKDENVIAMNDALLEFGSSFLNK